MCQLPAPIGRVSHMMHGHSGYSHISNQHGLAVDNIVAHEIVFPNGTIKTVKADDHDLWFALRASVSFV
ncbi:hypothetical protein B0F90DRAFT_293323 [Multifurca ochricompacta]|uniref:Uncharacterized protein n=1 Tax=Multifurca ochricompacta TaxID=376703 RepID=A0AAD4M584_9AGAM|nr:hypothetical protein B0F90DRAFT_293323 [Multifurca ochricompacta]